MRRRTWRGWAKSFGAAACWVGMSASAWATVPELVGRLTIVSQPGAAERLGVAPEKAKPLQTLIDQRIDAGTELMLEVKDLPPAEQEAKLAPFRLETEALAKKLLTPDEWKKIEQAAVRELGLRSLRDPEVAGKLELTVVQQQYRDRILSELERTRAAAADEGARRAQEAEADRKLRQILTAVQFQTWQGLAGEGAPVAPAATAGSAAPATTADVVKAVEAVKAADVAKPALDTAKPAETAKPSEAVKPLEAEPKAVVKAAVPAPKGPNGEPLLRFNFRFQPWGDVLDWFAQQADLSLVMDSAPAGTFNYTDQRSYTPAQAIDLLNGVLLTKGYTLVRRERMLMLVNLEDGIPANLVPYVPLEKLDASGEFELVKVLFPLTKLTPAEAELEVKPLLGPQGAVIPLLKARQLLVTDTAGRLRTVRAVLTAMENPAGGPQGAVKVLTYTKVQLADVLDLVKQLADVPPDRSAALDGSLRLAVDLPNNRIFVSGTAEKMTRMDEIFKLTDVPESAAKPEATALEAPQLEVYSVTSADPGAVLQVLQTLLAGQPDVRLANDPKTGAIVALARPAEHATIKATLAQMQKDVRRLEVFRLRTVDPATATASITKLFGGEGAVNAPVVESDPAGGQLLVRGSESQIEQIRMLLDKLGESGFSGSDLAGGDADRGNIRMVPLSGRAARNALEQIQQLWPAMRPNRIRVVGPTSGMPMMLPGEAPQDSSSLPSPLEQRINLQGLNNRPAAKPAPAAGRGTTAPGAAPATTPGAPGFGPPGGPGYGPGGPGYGPPGGPGDGPGGPGYGPPGGRDERDERREGDDRRDRRDREYRPDRGPTTAAPLPEEGRVARLDAAAAGSQESGSQGAGSPGAAEDLVQFPRFQIRKVSRAAADPDEDRSEESPASAAPAAKPVPKAEAAAKEPAAKGEAAKEKDGAWKAVDGAAPKKPAAEKAAGEKAEPAPAKPAGELAPIVIVPGANGLMISSEDTEALDDFEALLATLSSRSFTGGREYTIFYLKSASAQAVADTLGMLLTGSAPSDGGGGGGGSLLGDLAGAAFGGGGGGGGGLLGGLLGLGGGGGGGGSPIISSGSLQIVPEARLNALIVQGSPSEIDAVEQLLRVLDQDRLMETAISPKPRLIAVKNQPAEEIAATIKQAYADRITGGAAGGQRQPSPQEFIQMLRGGRGGNQRGGGQGGNQAEPVKFSVGVDARTNSLIVVAPQPLFEEVSQLVQTLDVASEENAQTTKVVTVKRGNAFAVQSALSAITGQQAKGATQQQPTARPQGGSTGRSTRGGQTGGAAPNPADFFNNMRRAMEGGGGNTGRGGAGGRGGTGGGFGGGTGGRGGR